MSVTIVSTLPKAPQAVGTDSSSSGDSVSAGQDFASLLLGQLLPVIPQVLSETVIQAGLPETRDDSPADAAAVLASLGLGASQQGRGVDTAADTLQVKGEVQALATGTSKSGTESSAALLTAGRAAPTQTPEESGNAKLPDLATPVVLAANDKPAKFAVAAPNYAPADSIQGNLPPPTVPTNAIITSNQVQNSSEAALSVNTPLRDQNWATDFGQKVMWLAGSEKHAAQLTLNPPQLGPIEISISVDKGNNATAAFVSANADVREAIETALPRLREMFASAGIALGQTNVGAESFQEQAANSNRGTSQWLGDKAILVSDSLSAQALRGEGTQQGRGLVDLFA